jgi:hypothetical protein
MAFVKKTRIFSAVLAAFMVISTSGANASAGDSLRFRFGAKAGAGTAYISHHHLYMLGNGRSTFTLGFLGEYRLKNWLAARVSVEYTHKGGAMLNPRLFYAKDSPMLAIPELGKTLYCTNLTIHTVEIPLTACFAIPLKNSAFKPFFIAGPSFGYNFFARADNYYLWEFDGAPNDLLDETSDWVTGQIVPWNLSVYTGLGTEITPGKRLTFEVGFTFRLGMTYEDNFYNTLYHKFSTVSTLVYVAVKL